MEQEGDCVENCLKEVLSGILASSVKERQTKCLRVCLSLSSSVFSSGCSFKNRCLYHKRCFKKNSLDKTKKSKQKFYRIGKKRHTGEKLNAHCLTEWRGQERCPPVLHMEGSQRHLCRKHRGCLGEFWDVLGMK